MKEITSKSELRMVLIAQGDVGKQKWYKSHDFPHLYFWNTEGKEHGDPSFPVLYTKLELLKEVSKETFGVEGYLSEIYKPI